MKALTLYQPWATLVSIGAKKLETRSWSTKYRGPLAIHASKSWTRYQREIWMLPRFCEALHDPDGEPFAIPLGAVIATCWLAAVQPINGFNRPGEDTDEFHFGDYGDGRFMWFLTDVQMLAEPVPAKGTLGLWKWNQ